MKMTNRIKWSVLGLACVAVAACDIINPAEEIPAFIYVPAFELQTDPATEGSNSSNITDVWVTSEGDFLGVYSLPARIPLLKSGDTQLSLRAGIKDNGINSTRDIYPFYKNYETTVDLQPNETDTIRPVITYRDDIKFSLIENFENGNNHQFQELRSGEEANKIVVTTQDAFEGASARILLDTASSFVELATVDRYPDLIKNGLLVYLEVNYRSEVPVIFGLVGYDVSDPFNSFPLYDPGFSPKGEWNKIYFNLSVLAIEGDFDQYQVGFNAFIPVEGGQLTLDKAQLQLDNIKLVHF
ncbi:MAG: hypothetical protein DHS20C18_19940 [Saprospiraceae bacterium]|nr:MAG: hypothetical protein DHS20C18_19940 [Saprospiraceae bacterium]